MEGWALLIHTCPIFLIISRRYQEKGVVRIDEEGARYVGIIQFSSENFAEVVGVAHLSFRRTQNSRSSLQSLLMFSENRLRR